MRILWYSSSPEVRTAYGIVTKEIVKRLQQAGHFVRVATKHEYLKHEVTPDGLEIVLGTDLHFLNRMIEDEDFDYVITFCELWDLWGKTPFPKKKWVAYAPTNTNEMPYAMKKVMKNTGIQIAMTAFGCEQIRREGYDCLYAPHGLNTHNFRPDESAGLELRTDTGWTSENFVIGSLGVNYPDDVKGFIPLMQAFKRFHAEHNEARLFICTFANERGIYPRHNYALIAHSLELDGLIGWPNQMDYFLGRLPVDDLRRIYNAFDIFCLPTKGESFCLPILEAQACSVPVIATNCTSCPELVKTGWLIPAGEDNLQWGTITSTWYANPSPIDIASKLEEAWLAWNEPDYAEMKAEARQGVLEYDWDTVWPKYWIPIMENLERRLRK